VLVRAVRDSGIDVVCVCGPSAVASALSVSGFDIKSFTFYGFLPKKQIDIDRVFHEIRDSKVEVFVFYESPKRIKNLAKTIIKELPGAEACFCAEISKLHEKCYCGKVEDILEELNADAKSEFGEYTAVVRKCPQANETIQHDGEQKGECAGQMHMSAEAILLDSMVKYSLDMKSAIESLSKNHLPFDCKYTKNELYRASLNIKNIIVK
jgi:16S rRNA (cytidine1402-2'-O)-methyltransferase